MHRVEDSRFQKPAAPTILFSWGARAFYVGPSFRLSPHRNAVAVLAIGVDQPFGVARDPKMPGSDYRSCRTALVPPNTLHHFDIKRGRVALLYVDARSRDLEHLQGLAAERTTNASFDLSIENELIELSAQLSDGKIDWKKARFQLVDHLGARASVQIDPRTERLVQRVHAEPASRTSLAHIAGQLGISESRLMHIFKRDIGIPFRRYRLWVSMGAAIRLIRDGATLTDAALGAGFSSSAHFSASFRQMFGIEPSRLGQSIMTAAREVIHDGAKG
jgi:AraC-like DNA-binding protein